VAPAGGNVAAIATAYRVEVGGALGAAARATIANVSGRAVAVFVAYRFGHANPIEAFFADEAVRVLGAGPGLIVGREAQTPRDDADDSNEKEMASAHDP
jgi:hypothetical protein